MAGLSSWLGCCIFLLSYSLYAPIQFWSLYFWHINSIQTVISCACSLCNIQSDFQILFGNDKHTTIRDTYKIIATNFSALAVLVLVTVMSRKNEWSSVFNIPVSILLIHCGSSNDIAFPFQGICKNVLRICIILLAWQEKCFNLRIRGNGDPGKKAYWRWSEGYVQAYRFHWRW